MPLLILYPPLFLRSGLMPTPKDITEVIALQVFLQGSLPVTQLSHPMKGGKAAMHRLRCPELGED